MASLCKGSNKPPGSLKAKEKIQPSAIRHYENLVREKSYHTELLQDGLNQGIRFQSRVDIQTALDRSVRYDPENNDAADGVRRLPKNLAMYC
ncbi:hypothetical protein ANN_11775 [Periplaneta americana]|uniref:Uncharacterized protein n=1 Tax=Periplaneta americana TaxID=6978 RepID=A0ABQ8T880_PERAM|nr:hypothetical protein ANN_11775 [Periplaneta americana]